MRVYATMPQDLRPADVAAYARRVEALGYDGLHVPDAVHDGLLRAHAALLATDRLTVATSVLVAFPRSPMTVAHAAWDLQSVSEGRFVLGLGSQVRRNVVERYSTPWAPPVPRMREYVLSLRAIWDSWQRGTKLDFRGEHYRFTRMQPFFSPGPIEKPAIPIWLGAVGPGMTALAGEVADGVVLHPTNSGPRFLRDLTLPALARGAARSGRSPDSVEVAAGSFVATGESPDAARAERERIRELLGFLYSTPAYGRTLELLGMADLGPALRRLAREGRWGEMSAAVPDALLDAVVPCAPYAEVGDLLASWFSELAGGITFPVPEGTHSLEGVFARLRSPGL